MKWIEWGSRDVGGMNELHDQMEIILQSTLVLITIKLVHFFIRGI